MKKTKFFVAAALIFFLPSLLFAASYDLTTQSFPDADNPSRPYTATVEDTATDVVSSDYLQIFDTLDPKTTYLISATKIQGLGAAKAFSATDITATGDITGDGGDQLFGFLQNQITSTTTALTAAQCGSTIVNDSADVLTLPEASTVIGCRFMFMTNNASNFDINPADASDTITLLTNAAGDAIRNATVGNFVCLQAVDGTNWSQCGILGTWTDIN